MPNLALRLRCGVMTIYGYVENKNVLLELISQRGLRDLRLQPVPPEPEAILLAWGRALRRTLLAHPSMALVFLAQPVVGPAIFRGVEALLSRLNGAGMASAEAARAIYAILIYTTGFVAWEIPRTVRQPQASYARSWRREFAGLPEGEFPLAGAVLDELGRVASEEQFELGLTSLASGLVVRPGAA